MKTLQKNQLIRRLALIAAALTLLLGPGNALAQRPLGIDVSSYQGTPTWSSVRGSGIVYAWAKATEGTTITDGDFTYNESNGKAAGVYMGAYHFAHPNLNSPGAEAGHFWGVAGGYITADGKTLMPMLDMEVFSGVVGASSYSDWANQWCNDIVNDAAAAGVPAKPAIYTSACSACNFNTSVAQWLSSIADYNGEGSQSGTPWSTCTGCEVWGPGVWTSWQYSSSGAVSGISGAVDLDVFNGNSAQLVSTMVVGASSGRMDVFVKGTDGRLYQKIYAGGGWSGFASPIAGTIASDPAAVSWGANRIDVFAESTTSTLIHAWYDGIRWTGWEDLGGTLTGAPTVCSMNSGRLDVFVKSTFGTLYQRFYTISGGWTGWFSPIAGTITSDPGAVSWGANRADVFAKSATATLIHAWWDGTRWNGWENLGGTLTGAPAVASRGSGQLDVFIKGTDNACWHKWCINAGTWYNWESLGGGLTSDPGAVSDSPGSVDVFAKGTDNTLWNDFWTGSAWSGWVTLGGTLTGKPAACSWSKTN